MFPEFGMSLGRRTSSAAGFETRMEGPPSPLAVAAVGELDGVLGMMVAAGADTTGAHAAVRTTSHIATTDRRREVAFIDCMPR